VLNHIIEKRTACKMIWIL